MTLLTAIVLNLHCKKLEGKSDAHAQEEHDTHRTIHFATIYKSRDIMDALDWPLTRMRSLHLYFLGVGITPTPKIGVRDAPNILLIVECDIFIFRI